MLEFINVVHLDDLCQGNLKSALVPRQKLIRGGGLHHAAREVAQQARRLGVRQRRPDELRTIEEVAAAESDATATDTVPETEDAAEESAIAPDDPDDEVEDVAAEATDESDDDESDEEA